MKNILFILGKWISGFVCVLKVYVYLIYFVSSGVSQLDNYNKNFGSWNNLIKVNGRNIIRKIGMRNFF